jgi:hypothetical protein
MSLAAARLKQAREFLLAHPDMSKSQVVTATGLSDSTVARARRDLVAEGRIAQARNTPVVVPEPQATQPTKPKGTVDPPPAVSAAPAVGVPSKAGSLLDHAALVELASMVDELVEAGDDEVIHKKLIKQCLIFALRPDLHPDTRMSASQMYGKLKDMARAKELGPGKPKTFAIGKARLTDLLVACGPEMVLAAVHDAFTVKGEPDDQAQNDQVAPVGGTPQAPGSAGHEGSVPPAEVVRPIDVEVRRHSDAPESVGDHYLPGL